jgi:hypothetical protein
MSQNSTQWDLGRFVKTLSFFGAVPFLSDLDWFQQWFGSRPNPKVDSRLIQSQSTAASKSTASVLVVGIASPTAVEIVNQLRQQGHAVQIGVTQPEQALPDQLQPIFDLNSPAQLNEQLAQVNAVLCCAEDVGLTEAAITALISNLTEPDLVRRPIFDFANPNGDMQEIWGALDDVVMGGVSQSSIRLTDGVAYFSGVVSTANSGGFASIRTRNLEPLLDLSADDGIELRVKGDGKRYKFMLRTETRWDGVAYCFSFDTVADQWITVRVPFAQLIPVFRARSVNDRSFDPGHISACQLMLSKFEYDGALNPHFEPGFFQLQVESIQAYRQPAQFVLIQPSAELELALQKSGLPYMILQPSRVTDMPGGQLLRVGNQPLEGEIGAADLASFSIAALDYPTARNRKLFVTSGGEGATRDWTSLLAAP